MEKMLIEQKTTENDLEIEILKHRLEFGALCIA